MNRWMPALAAILFLFQGTFAAYGAENPGTGKITIVASLFPQYDFARRIAGERADVSLLLPPGTESHAYDPRPGDIMKLNAADLFVYTGDDMEPWAGRVVQSLEGSRCLVVDASKGIALRRNHDHDHTHDHADRQHHHGYDPHIWLDPTLAAAMADNIADGLMQADPGHRDFYRENVFALKEELQRLDRDFSAAVASGTRDTLVFGGRFAYLYFIERYGLKYVTAYESCSMEAEPSVRQMANVIRYMKDNNVRHIFHEEFVEPRVARSIADQTGAELLLFSTVHNLSKAELESGIGYFDIMRSNLENVKKALQ